MSEIRRKRQKRVRLIRIIVVCVIVAAGISTYFLLRTTPEEEAEAAEPELQTAKVIQDDLILRATGAGTLVAGNEVTLGFEIEGTLAEVLVERGDSVEKNDLLARLSETDALEVYKEAELALAELTSPMSIAETKVEIAGLDESLLEAYNEFAYLYSPAMVYYEEMLIAAEDALIEAQAAGDEEAIASAEYTIGRAEANLIYYADVYEDEYVSDTFTVEEQDPDNPRKTIDVIYPPTDYEIENARTAYYLVKEQIAAAYVYVEALGTGVIPEGAMGDDISTLRSALKAVDEAQEDMESLSLYATIPGIVTELNNDVGEEPNSSFITILDLYHPYLEIYLDASDWEMLSAGNLVEVVFDSYPDLTLMGEVSYIDPFITSTGGASLIYGEVILDEESLAQITRLPIGSEATVDIIEGSAENAILVPIESLHQAGEQYSVFVVEGGETEVRFVEVGLMDTYYAEILSGLEVGEVVTTGIVETN